MKIAQLRLYINAILLLYLMWLPLFKLTKLEQLVPQKKKIYIQ